VAMTMVQAEDGGGNSEEEAFKISFTAGNNHIFADAENKIA